MPGAATILVVDDQPEVLRLMFAVLRRAGYHALTAGSAAEAVAVAQHLARLDALVADMTMPPPGESGEELAERLCALRPELRVILISGYPQEPVRSREGWSFLQKPFNSQVLLESVRRVLGD